MCCLVMATRKNYNFPRRFSVFLNNEIIVHRFSIYLVFIYLCNQRLFLVFCRQVESQDFFFQFYFIISFFTVQRTYEYKSIQFFVDSRENKIGSDDCKHSGFFGFFWPNKYVAIFSFFFKKLNMISKILKFRNLNSFILLLLQIFFLPLNFVLLRTAFLVV